MSSLGFTKLGTCCFLGLATQVLNGTAEECSSTTNLGLNFVRSLGWERRGVGSPPFVDHPASCLQ
jgi:hypothetical protein